jgi:hypothetical protein
MAFAPHVRVTARGLFDTTSNGGEQFEQWSWRLNFSDPSGSEDPVDDEAQLADIATDISNFHGRPGSWISRAAVLTEVKAARIGADGKYIGQPRSVVLSKAGGGPSLVYPPQVALAVSLGTTRRGATGRGRIFLPAPAMSIGGNTGRISTTDRNAVAGSVAQLLNDLNNQPRIDAFAPSVVIASSKGYNTEVNSVRVGDVLDTIRTRRNEMGESYSVLLPVT